MKTTLYVDDDLLARAKFLSGQKEKTALVNAGLEALIQKLASERLAVLSGALPTVKAPRRRRPNG